MTTRPSRVALSVLVVGLSIAMALARSAPAAQSKDGPKPVTFTADIAPLLAGKCQPCHFKGGKVFDKLPFDQYKTVAKIASRLHTRLKGADLDLVNRWIEQGTPE